MNKDNDTELFKNEDKGIVFKPMCICSLDITQTNHYFLYTKNHNEKIT